MDSTGAVAQVASRRSLTLVERIGFAFLAGFALTLAAIVVVDPYVLPLKRALPDVLDPLLKIITHFGEGHETLVPAGVTLLVALVLLAVGVRPAVRAWLREVALLASFVVISIGGLGILAALTKLALGRARPKIAALADVLHIEPLRFQAEFASMPSGHATTAGATAMVLALLFPRWRWAFAAGAVVVALSRVLLVQHYVSDVVLGLTIGGIGTYAIALAFAARGHVFAREGDCLVVLPSSRALWRDRPDWRGIVSRR